jgi:PAP2 superfamily protein
VPRCAVLTHVLRIGFITLLSGSMTSAVAQTAPAPATPRPFSSLFTHFGSNAVHLVDTQPMIILAAGGVIAGAVAASDADIRAKMTASNGVEDALDPGDILGSGYTQFGAAFGTYALGRLVHNRKTIEIGADLVEAQLLAGAITQGLKLAINRERPDGADYSFPSGHASVAFASAGVLQHHFGWKAGMAAYVGAAYVGTSRLSEDKHYLTDVIFGAAVGIASAHAQFIAHRRSNMTVMPVAMRGGVGVLVTALPQ